MTIYTEQLLAVTMNFKNSLAGKAGRENSSIQSIFDILTKINKNCN